MGRYRKKPVEIEARQFLGSTLELMTICEWMVKNGYPWLTGNALQPLTLEPEGADGIWIDPADGQLVIRTLEGDMKASVGNWIIRGVRGEFYPCREDIFNATYEPA